MMRSLWSDAAARGKNRLELLVYRSRLIGQAADLCVWGGGNTSTKCHERDFLGREQLVLRVKGSGSDLKSCEPKDFSPLPLSVLLPLLERDSMTDEEMVDYLDHCLMARRAPRPSIEALLHAFIPENDIDHTHADATLAITNTTRGKQLARALYGAELLWVPYVKPGFTLAKRMAELYRAHPEAKGALLEKHGLITWGETAKESYLRTIEMVSRAEAFIRKKRRKRKAFGGPLVTVLPGRERRVWLQAMLPHMRRAVSGHEQKILAITSSPDVLAFVNGRHARALSHIGPATPDHMLRTKRIPLFVRAPQNDPRKLTPRSLVAQIEHYAASHISYYQRFRQPGQPMLDPYPRVMLIPRVGMITTGKDRKNAEMVAEIYEHSIHVMRSASFVGEYRSLSLAKAFEMEYWSLELYKLSLAPPEASLARKVVLITGACGSIGRAIAECLVDHGAHVVVTDIHQGEVERLAATLNNRARTPRAVGVTLDVTNDSSVRKAFEQVLHAFGGLDIVVSNAGIARIAAIDRLSLEDWNQHLAVNATGHFLVAREALKLLKAQATGGALVFIATKNVLAPGKDFGAYSASKSAEAQLARILAIEGGAFGIRVNMVNPDGVFEGSGLWSQRVKQDRARSYGIAVNQLEDFYRKRNLLQTRILPQDVARSVLFLVSTDSAKTTGCIVTVDGGVREAFPR